MVSKSWVKRDPMFMKIVMCRNVQDIYEYKRKSNYNYALSPIQFIPLIAIGLFKWEAFKT